MILSVLVAIAAVLYVFFRRRFGYWGRRDVPFKPPRVPFGNSENVFRLKTPNWQQLRGFHDYGRERGFNYIGAWVLVQPVFMPINTELIKQILSKDHHHFMEKAFYINEKEQPLSAHLFAIGGEKWKTLRQKLTPTFTSGKMKMMLQTVLDCTGPLGGELEKLLRNNEALDIKEIAGKFTTDIIGSVAFGISCNSFKDPNAEFRKNGKKVFELTALGTGEKFFTFNFKGLSRFLGLVPFPREVSDFLTKIVKETIEYRESNSIKKNDFMQLLINMYKTGEVDGLKENSKNKFTLNEVVAQAFIFFIAGFETSSTTMTFAMYELAKHQDMQDKVRQEIREVLEKHKGKLSYEALGDLVYMKQVIDETLRKYPSVPTIDRKCTSDYKVPDSEVVIEAGTPVIISTMGLHRDPENFPDPERFDPERFSPENVGDIKPFAYLPFGEGPRMCLGLRFGVMQTKVGLFTLLKDYRFKLNAKTSPHIKAYDFSFTLCPKETLLLDFEKV